MKYKIQIKVLIPLCALLLCGVVVILERMGISHQNTASESKEYEELVFSKDIPLETSCLVLTSEDEVSDIYNSMMSIVLEGMKVGFESVDVEQEFDVEQLNNYDTVVITFQDWSLLGENLSPLFTWVKGGGNLMTTVTPLYNADFGTIQSKLGIRSIGDEYPPIYGVRLKNDCMIGATEEDVFWYDIEEGEELLTSLQVELDEQCQVWMESEDGTVPLIWTREWGSGRVAVINESIVEKYQRGFLCLTYSLLQDVIIYPVINGSAFYLDDFPSPVPSGNGTYIKRDYGVDISTFYSSIWWPQILKWEEQYGIYHTGLIIEEYSDEIEAPFDRNAAASSFLSYGNTLLNHGGELGFHGYNHMPLCLKGVDDEKQYGEYQLWNSTADMKASIRELADFSEELFPENKFQVYVPPSNIMSETGREALLEEYPGIGVIASTYLADADGNVYEQEFRVEEDGVISTPRIASGCLMNHYQKMVVLSELNFQYVQSHFMHPDDTLDEDRGAKEGWGYMSQEFEKYLDWIYTSAPNIRNVTGSGMGTAVLEYDKLTLQQKRTSEGLQVRLGSFTGDASFLLRVNEGKITGADGCVYQHVTGNLYAIQASEADMMIYLGE